MPSTSIKKKSIRRVQTQIGMSWTWVFKLVSMYFHLTDFTRRKHQFLNENRLRSIQVKSRLELYLRQPVAKAKSDANLYAENLPFRFRDLKRNVAVRQSLTLSVSFSKYERFTGDYFLKLSTTYNATQQPPPRRHRWA